MCMYVYIYIYIYTYIHRGILHIPEYTFTNLVKLGRRRQDTSRLELIAKESGVSKSAAPT